ncbi:MAG: hypothetical protein R3F12_05860 [Lysobacteraceae bacterium]|nr:hypothetical protein [Xanthomonadales bacterium]HPF73878.1 hypothetical protein [Xanthomonadaceae bacterium]HRX98511.1 hypothetical protein [Xanthomonadaceae bacterium]
MNAAYRQLRELLPTNVEAPDTRFPLDAKRIKVWVDSLPRANQQAVLRDVEEAISSVNAQRCDAGQRLAAMEALRPVVLESANLLQHSLSGATYPLTEQQAAAARQAHRLHARFAQGYLRVVVDHCAPAGSVPFMRGGQVAMALERSMFHASRRLLLGYGLYMSPSEGVWRDLHALYGFADSVKLTGKSVDDAGMPGATSPGHAYAHAVLLAVSNPYRFSQREQEQLWELCADLAHACTIDATEKEHRFPVAQRGDHIPNHPMDADDEEAGLRWFDLSSVASSIESALGDTRDGDVMLRPAQGKSLVAPADLLRRLRGGWVAAAARGHQRLQAGHKLDTVLGLSGLHYQLSEGQSFDGFMQRLGGARLGGGSERAAWAHGGTDSGNTQVAEATVLDQSLGGYRLRWTAEKRVRAKVGELIGLSLTGGGDANDWMVGVVRWLRYDPDGGMYAGVGLLARRAQPVGVRVLGGDGVSRPAQRGIRLQPIRGEEEGDWTLLVPAVIDARSPLEIAHNGVMDAFDEPEPAVLRLRPREVLETAGDYVLLAAERADRDALA